MAMKKSSFNMIPENFATAESNMSDNSNTSNNDNVTSVTQNQNTPNVTPIQQVAQTPVVTQEVPIPQPIQTQQVVQQVVQPVVIQEPVAQQRKRIYVSISMEHYQHAKRECGATGITLQDYFDSLIAKDMRENEPHYR